MTLTLTKRHFIVHLCQEMSAPTDSSCHPIFRTKILAQIHEVQIRNVFDLWHLGNNQKKKKYFEFIFQAFFFIICF